MNFFKKKNVLKQHALPITTAFICEILYHSLETEFWATYEQRNFWRTICRSEWERFEQFDPVLADELREAIRYLDEYVNALDWDETNKKIAWDKLIILQSALIEVVYASK